jgi:enoyl-CoA hydratase
VTIGRDEGGEGTASTEETPPVLRIEGARATITFNRPTRHNCLEPVDLATISGHLDRIEATPGLRVVVVTGTGRSFSSGFSLIALEGGKSTDGMAFPRLADRIEACRLPVIGALNGGVYGGATDLAMACDFRIGVDDMELCMPAAKLGVSYYHGGLRRFVAALGLGAAKRIFLTGTTLGALELLRLGYVDELVPRTALTARVGDLADSLSALAPGAVASMKAGLNAIAADRASSAEIDARYLQSLRSPEVREALTARAERRPPVFSQER